MATTRWSLVRRAGRNDPEGRRALDELCGSYWRPVYALYRRQGLRPEDAAERTQGLFLDLLQRGDLRRAEPGRGKFRTFLYTCARNFDAKQRERDGALKRGGAARTVPFDFDNEERSMRVEPMDAMDPARLFDRRWARTVIDAALAELADDERRAGRERVFAVLRPTLGGEPLPGGYTGAAERLGLSEGALKVAAHRLRRRFRDRLVATVGDTLDDGDDPDAELHALLEALS